MSIEDGTVERHARVAADPGRRRAVRGFGLGELNGVLGLWDKTDLLDRIADEGGAGVAEVAQAFVVAGLASRLKPLLVVAPRSRDAEGLVAALRSWLGDESVALFPAWEVLPGEAMSPTLEVMGRRIKVVAGLEGGTGPAVIVTAVRAFLQKVSPSSGNAIVLEQGKEFPLDAFADRLVDFGFDRNYLVEKPGEFSIRGGILDVFPPGARHPVRADFFGDEISSLREFSVSSQRSLGAAGSVTILPARELRLTEAVRERAKKAAGEGEAGGERGDRAADLHKIAEGISFAGMEAYLGVLEPGLRPVAQLLPGSSAVVLCDPKQCRDRAAGFLTQAQQWGTEDTAELFVDFSEAAQGAETIELWPYGRGEEGINLDVRGWDDFVGKPDKLAERLQTHLTGGATVVVAAGRGAARAKDVFAEAGLGLRLGPAHIGEASITTASVDRGFLLTLGPQESAVLALVGEGDLFGRRRPVTPEAYDSPARASALLLELAPGDYVVHETYGVGKYHGMVTRAIAGVSRDYLLLEYHGGDRLYVPTEQLAAVTKYTGGESPRLNRLGSADWEKARSRARRAVEDIVGELVVLYSKRISAQGHAFAPDTPWQRELEDSFPYIETPDQARAVDEVKADMEKATAMDRLICGDVGYGKTEIAVRAAFKAIQDSKQVAVLVPTTILAQQHTQTFKERFAGYPVEVAQLSRFLTGKEQSEVLEKMAAGKADVVIGTHRLLQRDVKFSDLGLLVVDEEQRFGVKHKEAIKHLRTTVDVLTLSATPIPRTLEMGLAGIRDMSLVDTPPLDRRPVLTYVGSYDDRMLVAAIRRELARDGQVFFVHNRVRSIKGAARKIAGLVPGARIEVAHGQMSESELERVMLDVWDGKVDVLVCTTIIESGLDIPAMNTLIVERADLLGLSQLYQLRGRVGRARERAYAYFFYPDEAVLTDEAHERLKTLGEFTELGSGFKIALRDLEIRGAGNMLGAEQSGHIAAIGFDLYMKMVGEAVSHIQGREPEEKIEVRIDLPVDAFVPASYISRESLRMDAYRQVEKIRSPEDAKAVRDELTDRYGPVPPEVKSLINVAELRAFMAENGVAELTERDGLLKVRPVPELRDSQQLRFHRLFPKGAYKEAAATLLIPAPAHRLSSWVLETLRAILA